MSEAKPTDEFGTVPKWPSSPPSAADLLTYYAGRGLFLSRVSWAHVGAEPGSHGFTRYMAHVIEKIDCHDKYLLLRALVDLDPRKADELAEQVWRAADAGDSYGEWLWEWAEDRGLDAEAICAQGDRVGAEGAARFSGRTLAEKHVEHYRSCNCLGDSGTCCDPACECHDEARHSDSREATNGC